MKETKFIEQNKEKWLKFEQLLKLKTRNPDQLSDLFIQITDDLSYAKSHYPNRSIKIYLNNLAQQLFYKIYKNRKEGKNRFVKFWLEDLPAVTYYSRKELVVSLVVFLIAALIGVISTANDADFTTTILGEEYVSMTMKNIEKGDPMAVYKTMGEFDMFLGISINNIMVAFNTFITGIFFSLGSVIIIFYNGMMIGTFQYFFIQQGLAIESMLTIWLHGTLEISAIIIAGGAGIVLGKGFVFPGTYSRLRAFQLSARQGFKLLIGIVPILVFAAIIESFLTRYTEVPSIVKLSLILSSLFFIIYYFILYPLRKSKSDNLAKISIPFTSTAEPEEVILKGEVKMNHTVFRETIIVYKKTFTKYIGPASVLMLGLVAIAAFSLKNQALSNSIDIEQLVIEKILIVANYGNMPYMFFAGLIYVSGITFFIQKQIRSFHNYSTSNQNLILSSLFAGVLINIPFFFSGFLCFLFFIVLFPSALYIAAILNSNSNISVGKAIGEFKSFLSSSFSKVMGLFSLLFFIFIVTLILFDSPFMTLYVDFIQSSLVADEKFTYYATLITNALVVFFCINVTFPIFLIAFNIQQYSLIEIKNAEFLNQNIVSFKNKYIK